MLSRIFRALFTLAGMLFGYGVSTLLLSEEVLGRFWEFNTGDVSGYDVYLSLYDGTAADYLKQIIRYRMGNFTPSMPVFGCCDKYVECSDAKRCVHSNPFYYRSCQYRTNLLAGRIFYGKNKNI